MMPDRSLSIVVVNYNSCELLRDCLHSINATCDGLNPEICLVDNNSPDNSVQMVRKTFPGVRIIANRINVGYARAVNQAIRESVGPYILILNADTVICPDALQSLLAFMEQHPDTGIAAPRLLYPDGRLQHSCRTFYTLKTILLRRSFLGKIFSESRTLKEHLMLEWDHAGEREVDWLLGAALIVRREALDQVGLMDERYFLYLEDVDWCYRMKISRWKVQYVPQAQLIHYHRQGSRSNSLFNRDVWIHLLSMLHYYDKWAGFLYVLKKLSHVLRRPLFIVLDSLGIWLSFRIASFLRKPAEPGGSEYTGLFPSYQSSLIAFSLLTIAVCYLMGLYEDKRSQPWIDRSLAVVKGVLLSGVIMGATMFLISRNLAAESGNLRSIVIYLAPAAAMILVAIHQLTHSASRWLWHYGFHLKRALIVGDDGIAADINKELSGKSALGYDSVGFISPMNSLKSSHGLQYMGSIDELIEVCDRERVREVVYVNVDRYYQNIIRSLIRCRRKLIDVRIVSSGFESETVDTRVNDFVGFPSIEYECKPSYYAGLAVKRIMDVTLSLLGLIVLSPLILFIVLQLRCEDGGVLFIQERIGKAGKPFSIYKFRSMVPDAEARKVYLENIASGGPLFKARNDPRVTRFGRFLRKYNLDEIPQLINILKGDMSLIGPRPPLAEELTAYEDWHKARLEVRPGITGLWQVDKQRKWKFDEMVKLDIHYILNWSLLLDLKILLQTPGAILRGTGFEG